MTSDNNHNDNKYNSTNNNEQTNHINEHTDTPYSYHIDHDASHYNDNNTQQQSSSSNDNDSIFHSVVPQNDLLPSKNLFANATGNVANGGLDTIALNDHTETYDGRYADNVDDQLNLENGKTLSNNSSRSNSTTNNNTFNNNSNTIQSNESDSFDIKKIKQEAQSINIDIDKQLKNNSNNTDKQANKPHPEQTASFLSYITFYWLNPYINYGFRNTITLNDIPHMRTDMTSEYLTDRFIECWNNEVKRNPDEPSMFRALSHAFGVEYMIAGLCNNVLNGIGFITPNLLNWLITYLETDNHLPPSERKPGWYGYMLAVGMFLCAVTTIALNNEFYRSSLITGIKIRAALIGAIYQKSLRLSPSARAKMSTGQITNMMSVDCTKIDLSCQFFHFSWSTVIQVIISIGLLIWQLSYSALPGIAIMFIFMPMQGFIMKFLGKARDSGAKMTDNRLKIMNEILQGIRVIKVYAWENSFLQRLVDARANEMKFIKRANYIRGLNGVLNTGLPAVMNFLPFMTLGLISVSNGNGGHLSAAAVFTGLVYLNMIRIPVIILPITFSMAADTRIAFKRIGAFLMSDELDDSFKPTRVQHSQNAIEMHNVDLTWDVSTDKIADPLIKEEIKRTQSQSQVDANNQANINGGEYVFELNNINITIPTGKLVAVIGAVGSGKSSLLQGIIGEMKRKSGEILICGSIGYCPQQAWIMNATLKDNILFGLPYDEQRYKDTIKACALESDLKVLPAGDSTEIGERGINLSGGQKQRVSLARSVYFNADIILWDDPLSAVDSHVSKYLFNNCVTGVLQDKTRILVTHQLQYCPRVDYIIHMKDGKIIEQGTYDELMDKQGEFTQLMNEYGGVNDDDSDSETVEIHAKQQDKQIDQTTQKLQQAVSDNNTNTTSKQSSHPIDDNLQKPAVTDKTKGQLIQIEDKASGTLGWPVYRFYMMACGGWPIFIVFLFWVAITLASRFLTDWWLTRWVAWSYGNLDYRAYIGIYAALTGAQFISGGFYNMLLADRSVKAATQLHNMSFSVVLHAPMSWFDTTPIGRIMNRFSRDQDVIDNLLMMENFRMIFYWFGTAIGTFIMISVFNPWFAIAIPFICSFFYITQLYYRRTSRELKRMDSITRSPLFAHFSETLSGLPTIRAYNRQMTFIHENQHRMDNNDRPYFLLQCSSRWLGERLEMMGACVTFLAAALGVATRHTINPAVVGLSLSYAFSLTQVLSFMVRNMVDTENNMDSVERTKSYTERIEQEASALTDYDKTVPSEWPNRGNIRFENISLRYRPGLPLVLKQLNASIHGGERIGVVGRTGAGKSSMMLALFRLVELSSGTIYIDDIDINKLGLTTLRSKLAIMPQDPVLYSGSIRSNLDPFNQYTDVRLWQALDKAYLREAIEKNDMKLEAVVTESGENYSVGQRCQICLARAMLRDASILIMDEATASIDMETDALIQQSIRKHFKCTVLTIAHRLNTIMDYDRVMVLSFGQIVEFDTPHKLLSNPDSIFTSMVAETGSENEKLLRQIAYQAEQQRRQGLPHGNVVDTQHQIPVPEDSQAPTITHHT